MARDAPQVSAPALPASTALMRGGFEIELTGAHRPGRDPVIVVAEGPAAESGQEDHVRGAASPAPFKVFFQKPARTVD